LLDELLSPVLEPAKQLGTIIRTANRIAENVICDRGKRIRESKRILEGRRKENASWPWAWTLEVTKLLEGPGSSYELFVKQHTAVDRIALAREIFFDEVRSARMAKVLNQRNS